MRRNLASKGFVHVKRDMGELSMPKHRELSKTSELQKRKVQEQPTRGNKGERSKADPKPR